MVGLVVVAHSRELARAAVDLALAMVPDRPPRVAIAAGAALGGGLGTDAIAVKGAIEEVDDGDGVVVLMDLGSAVLSTETALDFLDPELRRRVHLTAAPLVEGLVAAVVQAASDAPAETVVREASAGLYGKEVHLGVAAAAGQEVTEVSGPRTTFTIAVAHGLHARPAARLVAAVKRFDADVQIRNATSDSAFVPADSLSRVAAIGARHGHEVEVIATGPDALQVLAELQALAARSFDQPFAIETPAPLLVDVAGPLPASPGIAIGPKWTIREDDVSLPEPGDTQARSEMEKLHEAVAATRTEISNARERLQRAAGPASAAIFDAHELLLDDGEVRRSVKARIDKGSSAAAAWQAVLDEVEQEWSQLEDPYLNARAQDVRAVRNQLLRHLLGTRHHIASQQGILVAPELTPADVAELDAALVDGIVTAHGSPTSHTAILARALGIPAVVAAGNAVLEIADGTDIVIDGTTGTVLIGPAPETVEEYRARQQQQTAAAAAARGRAHQPAVTTDGATIEVAANIGSSADVAAVAASGADSVGVLRTEFFFIDRTDPPAPDEQESEYRRIAEAIGGRRLTIRTLDVGGDKSIPYIPMPHEDNPFLGVRGIRLSLLHPELFRQQLTAIVRVARDHPISVMFPMVTTVGELDRALAVVDDVCEAAGGRPRHLEVGMMVEVPAVAANAAPFTARVDFVSVGTNDLAQYTLATERGNERVAHLADALDPGVLRLIQSVIAVAGDTKVAVCGELASDLAAVPLLVGLGVDELSVTRFALPGVKDEIRHWSSAAAAELAAAALAVESAAEVRSLVAERRP